MLDLVETIERTLRRKVRRDLPWLEVGQQGRTLASYAPYASDSELHEMAGRIHARTIRRCGELLKEVPTGTARIKTFGTVPGRSRTAYRSRAGKLWCSRRLRGSGT